MKRKSLRRALAIFTLFFTVNTGMAQNKILIVTGGHDFEKKSFYEMFDSFQGMDYDTITQPHGNELLLTDKINEYSCIVYYDMYQGITENQKVAFLKLLEQGKGMVFLHHALVSYQDWPEFEKIIGGKYHQKASANQTPSTYRHDVDFMVENADKSHRVTQGINDFQIHDEVYGNFSVGNHVHPLLTTKHPESTSTIGWCHQYERSKIVYIQLGHDHQAYENDNYRKLVFNAINWASEK